METREIPRLGKVDRINCRNICKWKQ